MTADTKQFLKLAAKTSPKAAAEELAIPNDELGRLLDVGRVLLELQHVRAGQREIAVQVTHLADVFGRFAIGLDGLLDALKSDREAFLLVIRGPQGAKKECPPFGKGESGGISDTPHHLSVARGRTKEPVA